MWVMGGDCDPPFLIPGTSPMQQMAGKRAKRSQWGWKQDPLALIAIRDRVPNLAQVSLWGSRPVAAPLFPASPFSFPQEYTMLCLLCGRAEDSVSILPDDPRQMTPLF